MPTADHHGPRVFTPATAQRLGLQNRVMRRLRALGCRVLSVTLDSALTILVDASGAPVLRRQPGGICTRRTARADVVSIDMDGCRVMWLEARSC
ncbi:MAG TPA: hypothetical protein VJ603_00745 [Paucimonas sp.]|nr:hypothetical protein [Paucimonas sp.]